LKVIDVESMQERMRNLNCVDLNSPEALEAGSPHPTTMFTNANNNLLFPEKDDLGAHSDSECLDRSSAWMDSEEKNKVIHINLNSGANSKLCLVGRRKRR